MHFGRIDVVLNNAACTNVSEIESTPDAVARNVMEVDFWGATAVSKEAVRFFRDENPAGAGGLLLNVSSSLGHWALPCTSYYTAAKHALEGLTDVLIRELDPAWNIKICLVTPGAFRTDVKAKAAVAAVHPAYSSVAAVQEARGFLDQTWDPARPIRIGDAQKAAERIYAVSELPSPPRRLFLGTDCVAAVREHLEGILKELRESEAWADGLLEDD